MASTPYSATKSKLVRITRLDACGAPVFAARGSIVTGGFIKIEDKSTIEQGQEFKQKDAWGDYCVNETDTSLLTRVEPAIDFCKVDPDAIEIITAARAIAATVDEAYAAVGATIGFARANRATANFGMELWTKMAGGACSTDGDPLWIYTRWPWLYDGFVGDTTYENNTVTFPVTNLKSLGAPTAGLLAPYDGAPGRPAAVGEHEVQYVTDIQPPALSAGAVALVDPDA